MLREDLKFLLKDTIVDSKYDVRIHCGGCMGSLNNLYTIVKDMVNDLDIVINDIVMDVDTCEVCFNVYKGKSLDTEVIKVYVINCGDGNSLEIKECVESGTKCNG